MPQLYRSFRKNLNSLHNENDRLLLPDHTNSKKAQTKKNKHNSMPLTQDEIDGCRDAFLAFDKDRSGTIDVWELRQVLEAMGQKPTEEELFQMISEVDDNMSGSIDFGEFLKVRCFCAEFK